MAYGDFKDSTRKTVSDEILPKKAFDIAQIPNYDGILLQWFIIF